MGSQVRVFGTLVVFKLCFLVFSEGVGFNDYNVIRGTGSNFSNVLDGVDIPEKENAIYNTKFNFSDIVERFLASPGKVSNFDVSSGCLTQLHALNDEKHQDVLLQMVDAWSKFPYTGVLRASRTDFGSYDECVEIKRQTQDAGTILGKHCTYGFVLPDFTQSNNKTMLENSWKLSYCVPHLCSASDLNNITHLPSLFNEAICVTQETGKDLNTGALVSIAIFAIFPVLICLSTLYDVMVYKTKSSWAGKFILTAFSLRANGKTLLSYVKSSKEQILCFHGLKFISMWWIMAGHNGVSWQTYGLYNAGDAAQWEASNSAFYLMSAHLAVDTFFYISGFLLSYLYFKNSLSKKSFWVQASAVPSMILHRYLRLTPALLMTYLFFTFLLSYIGDGPYYNYQAAHVLTQPCRDYWYSIFAYIQNYYNKDNLCLTTLWYVSADMQLFLVSPLIMIPVALLYRRSYKTAMAALFSVNILFLVLPIFTKLTWRDYDPNFADFDAHSRLIDYFIGVMMGLYVRHTKDQPIKINRMLNVLIWIFALGAMFTCAFVTQVVNVNYGYVAKAITYSLTRPSWCLGLCWITYACFNGHGGLINKLLSNRIMQLGGKLTFCLYLIHGPLIAYFTLEIRTRRFFSHIYVFYDWAGHFLLALVVATIWALSFEFPMITVERYIFGGIKPVPKTKTKETNNIQ